MQDNSIDAWVIDMPGLFSREKDYSLLLSTKELERAHRFVTDELTSRYIASHAAMRLILASYLEVDPKTIDYLRGPRGKPYLEDYPVHFSLAHSHDVALIGVSLHGELGVDVERVNPETVKKNLHESVFHSGELERWAPLTDSEKPEAFFSAWTHKEALLKLLGTGLYKDMKELDTPLHLLPHTTEVTVDAGPHYLRSFYATPDYIGAVASYEPEIQLHIRHFDLYLT